METDLQLITTETSVNQLISPALQEIVLQAIKAKLASFQQDFPENIYELVVVELEKPLLEAVLTYTRGNQSKAAMLLGLSRGTLRKKLKAQEAIKRASEHEIEKR